MFHFVLLMSRKYNIDESHGITHSMNVLNYAHNIYTDEVNKLPYIKDYEKIIYVSAVLHDMCDKKYVDENRGINEINSFLQDTNKMSPMEIDVTKKIIKTMSYSTVKKNGFPQLNDFQPAYHIVREADLLTAYDFDRCMIYNMNKKYGNIHDAFIEANAIFEKRVFKHESDGLLLTDYARNQHMELKNLALNRIRSWKYILHNNFMH